MPNSSDQNRAKLREHGYTWMLKAPTGEMVTVAEAMRRITDAERIQKQERDDLEFSTPAGIEVSWRGYFEEEVQDHPDVVAMHQEGDSYVIFPLGTRFEPSVVTEPPDEEKKPRHPWGKHFYAGRYTLPDGAVFILRDGNMEQEGAAV